MLTESLEDYLESILVLKYSKNMVRIKDIVEYNGVKNSSVVNAMKQLKDGGFVIYEKYRHIDLTEDGLEKASRIYSKHRAIARFFKDVLKISDRSSKKMACEIEHHMDIEQVKKLNCLTSYFVREKLSEVITCENANKKCNEKNSRPLVLLKAGERGIFIRFADKDTSKRLNWIHLTPGTPFEVSRISLDHSIIEICHSGGYHSLSREDAEKMIIGDEK